METQTPRINPLHPILFLLSLLFALSAGGAFLGTVSLIYSKQNTLPKLSAELENITREETYYRGLKKTLADTEGARAALTSFFVNPNDFVPFIEAVEALGARAGVTLTIENAVLVDDNRNLALTLFSGGEFQEVLYFLSLLEAFPAKISFDRAWVAQGVPGKKTGVSFSPWEGRFTIKFASI